MEKMGDKITGFYLTMGEYDDVGIGEAPNDEVACTYLLGLGASDDVKTTTLKTLTIEEFKGIVKIKYWLKPGEHHPKYIL